MAELKIRDAKLVQYLNEAYGKEKELETALAAHIGMTTRAPYKKRLQQHLGETKRHARELERAVKRLGGTAQVVRIEGLDPIAKGAGAALELGSRAMAAAKGPLHAIRGTGEQEKMLKNAKSEYADEHEEIATYTAIETLAQELGDPDTVKLARAIRREEQGMARFLERLIPTLTKAVTQAEVPAAERANGRRGARRRSSSARSRGRSRSTAKAGSTRSGSKARTRAGAKSTRSGSKAASRSGSKAASRATAGSSRSRVRANA
jgi:ferritin-like metal-binding protein YciE